MILENIVTSLKLSQKLEEAGVKQESLFYWYERNNEIVVADYLFINRYLDIVKKYSAFTAQELWDMIEACYGIAVVNNKSTLGTPYSIVVNGKDLYHGDSVADCLAQLIIAQHEDKKKMQVISEPEFKEAITKVLADIKCGSVTGPGRSGAIAAVYASQYSTCSIYAL